MLYIKRDNTHAHKDKGLYLLNIDAGEGEVRRVGDESRSLEIMSKLHSTWSITPPLQFSLFIFT